MRIARTVTGRDRVVFFAGDYHGQFDEVLVKQLKRKGEILSQPAAPGIPRANLGNITVLDYGTDEALKYIEQHADELAAVLIEPVQSRHPNLQPKEFLLRVREITRQSGAAFIFDEVVNGFRIHPARGPGLLRHRRRYGDLRQSDWRRHADRHSCRQGRIHGCAGRWNLAVWRCFGSRGRSDVLCRYICPASADDGGAVRYAGAHSRCWAGTL